MRIAMVGNFGFGDKQTMAERALPIAEALSARGHQVLIALPSRSKEEQPRETSPTSVAITFASRGVPFPGVAHAWQTTRLLFHSLAWRPDAVYCFKPIAFAGGVLAGLSLLRRLGIYRGAILLDTDDWEGDGGWNDIQPFPGWLKRIISIQERWSLQHADVVTVASRALEELVREAGARRVSYVPNAVRSIAALDPEGAGNDLRERLGLASRPVLLLYTRFVEFDVDRVLDVLQRVAEITPGVALLVAGKGFSGEEEKLMRLAEERGVADRIAPLGWVQTADLPSVFRTADVAIYPLDDTLLNRTKCPAKLRDLIAAGVPVVADRVGQANEYIEDDATGKLVAAGDPGEMAAAVAELLSDPAARRRLSAAAIQDVRRRWMWENWIPVVESALEAAMRERRCSRNAPD